MEVEPVADEGQAPEPENGLNGDAPESEQAPQESDDLLRHDQQELPERVAHLEKRVRDQDDEIVCLKGALAEVMRRMQQVEAASKAQNSLLPSKPYPKSPRRAPSGQDRPKSMVSDSFSHRTPASPRATPRGASASSVGKKWGSVSNNIDETNGHKSSRPSSQLTHANPRDPTWNKENMYLKMYLGGRPIPLYAPSDSYDYKVDAPQDPPPQKLKLEWVYGYRGRDARSNLYQLFSGELVYFTAAIVVLHDIDDNSQRFYVEHNDDIKCLAVHPDGRIIATGQVCGHDKKAHIRIWEHMNLHTLHTIGFENEEFQRGLCCVGFGKVGKTSILFGIDDANDHNLSIWNFDKKEPKKIAEGKSSRDPVTQCEFVPESEKELVLCGKNNMSFWTLEGGKLSKKMGIFGSRGEKPSVMICFAFVENGEVISGDSTGNLYIWEAGSNTLKEVIKDAHDGGIFSICVKADGTILTGGKDRKIKMWRADYSSTNEERELKEQYGCPRMITQGKGNMMYVGTIRNCILQGNMDMMFDQVVVEGHKAELWGCDTHPDLHQFITCGYDQHVYLWDSAARKCVWSEVFKYSAHCCCFHPEKNVVAIGMQSPNILLFHLDKRDHTMPYKTGNEQIECIQYSPRLESEDSEDRLYKLAAGSRDNNIYVFREDKDDASKLHKVGKCSGHHSFVRHIDWDTTGKIIRSDSGDYEVLYWDAETCKQETDKDRVRDLKWATNNCVLSFNTIGLWQDGADGTDLNNCGMSHDGNLIASADDFGKVTLYKYPSIQHTATGHSYKGHSSHVTMAKFICDDSRVITTGGNDCTIIQWKVE